jgi:NAD(P)-dependent dehydrogenase (short-subunit alcohol dehydrogenase family)
MRLKEKVIIVTGSTTGIGEAIARRCAAEGARVLVHGRERARGAALVAELGDTAALHIDDLSDPAAAQRIVAAALDAFGRIDALVNNAAWVVRSTLETTSAEFFDRVLAINVRAPLLLIQAAREELEKTKGCVLNIGSVNAHCGEATLLDYSISKGALMTMSRNLADALGSRQVRINQFNVGWVLTANENRLQLADGQPEGWHENVSVQQAPSGRLIRPEAIAAAAVYWLSDESRPITGSVLELEQYPVIGRNPVKGE